MKSEERKEYKDRISEKQKILSDQGRIFICDERWEKAYGISFSGIYNDAVKRRLSSAVFQSLDRII